MLAHKICRTKLGMLSVNRGSRELAAHVKKKACGVLPENFLMLTSVRRMMCASKHLSGNGKSMCDRKASGFWLEDDVVFLLQMGTNFSCVARPFVARNCYFCMSAMTLGRSMLGPKPAAKVFKKLKILVSAVRFRPRPPDSKPWISNDSGLFCI